MEIREGKLMIHSILVSRSSATARESARACEIERVRERESASANVCVRERAIE